MSTETMKAIRLHAFGGPEVLRYEDAPKPASQAGEVLVRVHAVGINPPDWYLRDGFQSLPADWRPAVALPVIPGTDLSGVVEALAPDVTGLRVGDAVFGMVRFPGGARTPSTWRRRPPTWRASRTASIMRARPPRRWRC